MAGSSLAMTARVDPRQRFIRWQFGSLSGRAPLQFDLAGRSAARTDDDLPGMTHQVGVGEFRARPFVAIVVQGGCAKLLVQRLAQRIACRIATPQVQDRGLERRNGIGPDDARFVVASPRSPRPPDAKHRRRSCPSPDEPACHPAPPPSCSSPWYICCRNRRCGRPRCRGLRAGEPDPQVPTSPGHVSRRWRHTSTSSA